MTDDRTRMFQPEAKGPGHVRQVMRDVREALLDKGYDPVVQVVGYLLSGDPAYITAHRNARQTIRAIPRDEILEELVRSYLDG